MATSPAHPSTAIDMGGMQTSPYIDTSMGMTPLEGLMMGTRSGDIDAGAVLYIMKKEGLTPDQTSDLLNKKSGVLGMFKRSSDMALGTWGTVNGQEMLFEK